MSPCRHLLLGCVSPMAEATQLTTSWSSANCVLFEDSDILRDSLLYRHIERQRWILKDFFDGNKKGPSCFERCMKPCQGGRQFSKKQFYRFISAQSVYTVFFKREKWKIPVFYCLIFRHYMKST